jgi:predicted dehydrogenase
MLETVVVGTGMMGRLVCPSIRAAGSEVVGVVGRTKEKADQLAKDMRLPYVRDTGGEADFDRIIGLGNTVALMVPNHLHASLAIRAAEAGKHVLLEKPLATNYKEGLEMFEAIQEAGVAAEINSQYRHHEMVQYMKDTVSSERLGKPVSVRMVYLQDWQLDPFAAIGWRPEVAIAGKGKLVGDLGAHVLQTTYELFGGKIADFEGETFNVHPIRYMFNGDVQTFGGGRVPSYAENPALYTEMDMLSGKYSGDDRATAKFVVEMENGRRVPGTYELSQVHAGEKNGFRIEIVYTNGRQVWDQETPNHVWETGKICKVTKEERGSAPGIIGTPPGHPAGYGTSITAGVLKLDDVVRSADGSRIREYTEKNMREALNAVHLMQTWLSKPLIHY